jgi:putative DNA primase/helicase
MALGKRHSRKDAMDSTIHQTRDTGQTPQRSALYPGPTPQDLARIPEDLKQQSQWVLWRGADRIEQETGEITGLEKVPIDPQTLRHASSTDDETWGNFQQCVDALPCVLEEWEHEDHAGYRGGGIGFVVVLDDPYCGVDLDKCRDPQTGTIAVWALEIIAALASYTEISPSQTGIRIFVQGTLPPTGRKKGSVEMYNHARFFTLTGWHLATTPTMVEARQAALTLLHRETFGTTSPAAAPGSAVPHVSPAMTDTVILDHARGAKNNGKFTALWGGHWQDCGYASQSDADCGLCMELAFWTQDPEQIARLFEQSGLYRAKKWGKRPDYRQRTIYAALAYRETFYQPTAWLEEQIQQAHPNGSGPTTRAEGEAQDTAQDPPLPLSDYTNALAFVRDHGEDLRYCEAWKKWLIWDGTHWNCDMQAPVLQKAKATIKRLLRNAARLDDDAYKAWLVHIKRSLSTAALKAMVESAQNEPGMPVTINQLNQYPWLLPCANGTLDLRTGTRRPSTRTDLLTECLRVAYDSGTICPTWEAFLWQIMGGTKRSEDTEAMGPGELEDRDRADTRAQSMCTYLQRILGQCLTGDVSEQDLYVFYGTGANGKSTLINTILQLLGRYAMKGTAELLMTTRNDRHPTERADLFGKRLVATIETEQAGRLNETFIKEATGGDPIRTRRMREDFWEFLPTHKIILATNHKPEIRGTDHAIWRRIKLIPFTVTIADADQDKTLPQKLQQELPGILAWMVRGCLDWQINGMQTPEEVRIATADYRKEQDVFEDFLATECHRVTTARCAAADLYITYERWCTANDIDPMKKRTFGIRLGDCGFTPDQGTGGRREWVGIGLPSKEEEGRRYGA